VCCFSNYFFQFFTTPSNSILSYSLPACKVDTLVYLEKYNRPLSIKREFVLQEPIIGRRKFYSEEETQQNKSTTKGENKNISKKVQSQNTTDP